MRRFFVALAAATALCAYAPTSASAAPAGPLSVSAGSEIVLVAQGCGRGWHRAPSGRCVRNTGPAHGPCWWVRGPGGWRLVCR